ncbi:hypothetical protein D3C84_955270 [compost metagenome]
MGRAKDHMVALGPGHQPGHQLAIDMEQRQATKDDLATTAWLQMSRHRPCVEYFRTMGTRGDLGQPGGAACTDVGGAFVRASLPTALEVCVRLGIHQRLPIVDRDIVSFLQCRGFGSPTY